jgi:hypothetical protein
MGAQGPQQQHRVRGLLHDARVDFLLSHPDGPAAARRWGDVVGHQVEYPRPVHVPRGRETRHDDVEVMAGTCIGTHIPL